MYQSISIINNFKSHVFESEITSLSKENSDLKDEKKRILGQLHEVTNNLLTKTTDSYQQMDMIKNLSSQLENIDRSINKN